MLHGILLTVHLILCLILIGVILLQAGRGGGLADSFGGGSAQAMLGSRGGEVLAKLTAGVAAAFIITSIALAVLSAREGHSLTESVRTAPVEATPESPAPAKESAGPSDTPTDKKAPAGDEPAAP
ncbi:MAG: preprotein translocase subunit SecG [Candidatus Omnitrophica bacterium CG11_big_fil_rev_8_21_14_0_20_64_10]|nr:MAG: preprotein translocase subunit SecG [Candidatus Omnitrophica bacterium CG11_big_fil_rev_8_21_14_0_20_64_10]